MKRHAFCPKAQRLPVDADDDTQRQQRGPEKGATHGGGVQRVQHAAYTCLQQQAIYVMKVHARQVRSSLRSKRKWYSPCTSQNGETWNCLCATCSFPQARSGPASR